MHPFWGAELARGVDLRACRTPADTLLALRGGKPQRGWLFGWGLDYDAAPTPAEIADALPGVAVVVRMMDLHTALATPTALRWAQVTGPVEFPDSSMVVVDEDGVPTGELREGAAQDLVLRAGPRMRWPDLRARHVEILGELNALGLTGAHVMDGDRARWSCCATSRARTSCRCACGSRSGSRPSSTTRRSRSGSSCATRAGSSGPAAWPSSSPTA